MNDSKKFMQVALAENKDFTGPPAPMVPFADWDYYYTKGVVDWEPSAGSLQAVKIPIGFVTDLASIPRVFWSLLSPHARYTYPAVVHDYLYWEQPCDRDIADQVLKLAMQEMDVAKVTVLAIYEAVHVGGARAWSSNAKAKANGESRFLKRFPPDVKITWKEWKSDPDNFR
jgi:Protein of unknown function (DUF1353)